MRARGNPCAAFALAATVLLAGAGAARADQSAETSRETQRLQSSGNALAAESQGVLLELYALESELDRARARAATLRSATAEVEREADSTRDRLVLVRRTLREAEGRLGERLRELYVRGEPDALAALLGAQTLTEMLSTFDSLDRFAKQDRVVIAQVRRARKDVARAVRDLEQRAGELRTLATQAGAAESALAQTAASRRAYLARLVSERRVNQAQLAKLTSQAQSAEARNDEVAGSGSAPRGAGGGSSSPTAPPSAPSPSPTPSIGPGTQMTVQATGYALPGTTATGVPVGWGIVAVDPDVIPLGTRMTIPGYGEGVAADTGSAVQGAIIDLWFPTRAQALTWGRRTVTITLH